MKLLSNPARARAPADRQPRVLLVESDPYLAFLIRLHVPEASVIEAGPGVDASDIVRMEPDLVVAGLESAGGAVAELLSGENRPRVLAVVDGARAARTTIPSDVDGILARPFVPAELNRAIRGALGLRSEKDDPPTTTLQRARAWVGPARIAAVSLAAILEVAGGHVSHQRAWILASAFAYAASRWILRRPNTIAEGSDVAVAVALIAATGGVSSNYLPFGIAVVIGIGLTRGPKWGSAAGFAIVAGSSTIVARDLGLRRVAPREVAAWLIFLPLLGLTGGFASRVWRIPAQEGLDVLVEANRVLSSLYRIARTLPGGLEIGSVADAAMQEVRDALRASAGAVLLSEVGTFVTVGSFGLRDPTAIVVQDMSSGLGAAIHRATPVVKREDLPPATVLALGDFDCWLTAPMRHEGLPIGLLLAACPDDSRHDANRLLLQRLADETAVAVENARLFSRVREISIDEERRRLARELHDGVAQALTHLRFELDFMGRHGVASPEQVKKEVDRLSRVVGRASNDIRSMIMGLRSSVSAEGLVGSLRSYLSDLRGLGGPEIVFEARGEVKLRPDVETEVFRVTQEAVSNALRHAGAEQVKVSLSATVARLTLTVEDDGVGIISKRPRSGTGGVGLDAMQERAELIGATLEVGKGQGGAGTLVRLEYVVEEKA